MFFFRAFIYKIFFFHSTDHLKVQQQSALINSPIFPSGSNASVNLSGVQNDDIGHKSPAHQQRQATPSVQQQQQQHTGLYLANEWLLVNLQMHSVF